MADEIPPTDPSPAPQEASNAAAVAANAGAAAAVVADAGAATAMVADAGAATDAKAAPETPAAAVAAVAAVAAGAEGAHAAGMDQGTIDDLLQQANFEDPATIEGGLPDAGTAEFRLPDFQQVMQDAQASSIDLLRDVDLHVKIELGRARMLVEEVLKLGEGSVVELDKLAGDPVDIFVNDRLVARGEVLVLNDNFCVRINEIVAGIKEEGG